MSDQESIKGLPASWNPNFEMGLKPFWKENRASITRNDGFLLERDFLQTEFPDHNILFLDGAIRPLVTTHKLSTLDFSKIDMVIIDNTEGAVTSYMCDVLMPNEFTRLDFAAGPNDEIPAHQKGKWMTSIFVKLSRQYQEINTWTSPRMTEEERRKHMAENTESIEKAHSRVNTMKKYISEKLGL